MTRQVDPSRNSPVFLDQLSPHKPSVTSDSSPPPWYKSHTGNSFTEELDHREEDLDRLTAASTPLHINTGKSTLFTSPLKRLDQLDLNHSSPQIPSIPKLGSEIPRPERNKIRYNEIQSDDDDENESSGFNEEIGNITFVDTTDYNPVNDGDKYHCPLEYLEPPTYIRKRKLGESSTDIAMTPSFSCIENSSHQPEDMSGIIGNETNESLKISFSASDSTPCPPQPRKRLKLEGSIQETTPSQPSRVTGLILNLNSSKKLSASSVPLLSKLNNATSDTADEVSSFNSLSSVTKISSSKSKACSTPISQSTPANSRPSSPAFVTEVSDEEVNGYRFVKPRLKFNYETPQPRTFSNHPYKLQNNVSRGLVNEYNATNSGLSFKNYNIVGKFPVSAAGLMDEEDGNIHIADKRISDPYLLAPPSGPNKGGSPELLFQYMDSRYKLPLDEHFDKDLELDEMKQLISDGRSVIEFYRKIISLSELDMHRFLKRERLRWHPDKWASRLEDSPFDKAVIDLLSQEINRLIEEN